MDWTIFDSLSLPIDYQLKNKITHYYDLLIQENQKHNLTRIVSQEEMLTKHFLDSLLFTQKISLKNQSLADIGSGAGFPGLVLKIFYPDLDVTLIEANQKKANFLRLVIKELKLKKVKVINDRAEGYARSHRQQFDIVVSRAVANLRILLELGAPLLKEQGIFVALKGPKVREEQALIFGLDRKLGLKFNHQQIVNNYNYGERVNVFYKKVSPTPEKYPRAYQIIKKESNSLGKK